MLETTATKLRKNLPKEIEPCFKNHETLHVKQRDGKDFVIISAEDWRSIEETLFLNSIPNMVASIHEAANELQTNDIEQLPLEAKHEIEAFIAFVKTRYQSVANKRQPEITKGDKSINPSDLFGLWEQQPKDIKNIRKQAWQRSETEL